MSGVFQSQRVVIGANIAGALLAALSVRPAAALVAAPKVRLSNLAGYNPVSGAALTYFTDHECGYSGYTAGGIAPTFTAPVNVSPNIRGAIASVLFEATLADPQVSDTATGWWLDDGTNMVLAEAFPLGTSFGFSRPGDFLELVLVFPVGLIQATQ